MSESGTRLQNIYIKRFELLQKQWRKKAR